MQKRPRVLTNIRFYTVAGIAQYLSGLIDYNEGKQLLDLYGVDIFRPGEIQDSLPRGRRFKHFHLIKRVIDYPPLGVVNQLSQGDLAVLAQSYREVIETYLREIRRIRPDVILVNGSYFLPWCLMQAARIYGKAAICMHYHGILKKEVEHWPNATDKTTMLKMERSFDDERVFYIFPSRLAKQAVEREVFGHKISRSTVMPNPVAHSFFAAAPRRKGIRRVGVVSRWSKIKNIDFIISMAKENRRSRGGLEFNIITDLKSSTDKKPFKQLFRFKKPLANAKLPGFYSRQGVVISPSVFETYGNVAQEAVASGTPALVSQKMGVAEIFRKVGLKDWVIDFDSPGAVIRKVGKVIDSEVPPECIRALRDEVASDRIYGAYAALLSSVR